MLAVRTVDELGMERPAARSPRWSAGPSLLVALAAAALTAAPVDPARGAEPGTFTLSRDPAVVVLQYASSTGLSGKVTQFTLYGDGKLEREEQPRDRRTTVTLTAASVQELVGLAMRYGLAEASQEKVDAKISKQLGRTMYAIAGQGATRVIFSLHLDAYAPPDGSGERPVDAAVLVLGLEELARQCQDCAELQGLVALERELETRFAKGRR